MKKILAAVMAGAMAAWPGVASATEAYWDLVNKANTSTGVKVDGDKNLVGAGLDAASMNRGLLPNERVDASSVTKQGNSFNGASQLVKLDGSAALPAVSGAALTALDAGNLASGTVPNARIDASSVTKLGPAIGTAELDFDPATQSELDTHGGLTGANAHSASSYTVSQIVARDAAGNFAAGTITANITGSVSGNATTASALQANGANCSAGESPLGVDAGGAAEACFDVATQTELGNHDTNAGAHSSGIAGNAATASALAANPTDCSAGNFANAIVANGNLTCSADGSSLTGLNASNLGSGTVPNERLDASSVTKLGASIESAEITSVAAGKITAGALAADVIASSVAVNTVGTGQLSFDPATQAELDTHSGLGGSSAHSATALNTASQIITRDGSGNFAAGTITANLTGNASGNAGTATALAADGSNCSAGNSPLGVDVSGAAQSCFDVATQGELDTHSGLTGSNVHSASSFTANQIVARDPSGNFAAGTITASITGNVSGNAGTASALAANGGNCSAGNAPLGVDAAGAAESCFDVGTQSELDTHSGLSGSSAHSASSFTANQIVTRDPSGDFAAGTVTAALAGNAATSSALASNGSNCSAGSFPLGVDAAGAAESCTDGATQSELDTHAGLTGSSAHGATAVNTASAIVTRDGAGNFAAGTITAALTGTASAASALAANPSDCSAGEFANAIAASGNLTCSADGSSLTNLNASNLGSGTVPSERIDSTSATLQGNAFNGNSQLVKTTADGKLPVIDGSNLTNVAAGSVAAANVTAGTFSGSFTFGSQLVIQGLTDYGARTSAQIGALACVAGIGACRAQSTNDGDIYTSTGSATGQWRNSRTGIGP